MLRHAPSYHDWFVSAVDLPSVIDAIRHPDHDAPEGRESTGRAFVAPVEATPLDPSFQPLSAASYKMFSCDLSEHGLGLMYVHPVDAPYVALTFYDDEGQRIRLMGEITRCTRSEADEQLFRIGVRFVTREEHDPT